MGRAHKTVIRPVQVLQNWILKYMTFSKRTSSASYIFKLLKILKVSYLYQLNLEKFMYKYNADILPSSFDNFFWKLYNIHIMAQDKFQGIFIINMLELIRVKKCCNVGPVAWVCISNNVKMLPLHTFLNQVKSQLLTCSANMTWLDLNWACISWDIAVKIECCKVMKNAILG